MRKFRIAELEQHSGSSYPAPFDEPCLARSWQGLAAAGELTQFGVNQVRLKPGGWSFQRHWHSHEDELVIMLEGEAVLVTDEGERNGHHLQNRSDADCVFLAIGSRSDEDAGEYPDIDLRVRPGRYSKPAVFTKKRDEPY